MANNKTNFNRVEMLGSIYGLTNANGVLYFNLCYGTAYNGQMTQNYVPCVVEQTRATALAPKLAEGGAISAVGRLVVSRKKDQLGNYTTQFVVKLNNVTRVAGLDNGEGHCNIVVEGNLSRDANKTQKGYVSTVACDHYADGCQYIDFFDSRKNAPALSNIMTKGNRVLVSGNLKGKVNQQTGQIDGYSINASEVEILAYKNQGQQVQMAQQPMMQNGQMQVQQPVMQQQVATQPQMVQQVAQQPMMQGQPQMAQPQAAAVQQPVPMQPQPQIQSAQFPQVNVAPIGLQNDTLNYDVAVEGQTISF